MEEEAQVEVPCYFVCPISLHMMRDPVTLPTGMTYDRDGIERWLLTAGTCPLTKQPVPADCDPTPNHTLRRLIQSWGAAHGLVQRVATPPPKPPITDVASRIGGAASNNFTQELLAALRELRGVVASEESQRSCRNDDAACAAVDTLVGVFITASASATTSTSSVAVCDEVLEIISSSDKCLLAARAIMETNTNEAAVDALVSALCRSNTTSRAHATLLLRNVTAVLPTSSLASLPEQVFGEVVRLIRDKQQVSRAATTKAALHVLVGTTPWGRNRVKAVDAGAAPALVDMLLDLDGPERRACELALGALGRLCGCAEGRAALVAHGAGVAAVASKALRVSDVATDKAVRVLRSVARHAATAAVVQEMAHTGVPGTLCVVAQSEQYGDRTRERARETLRRHARAWRSSPCLHHHLQAMYP